MEVMLCSFDGGQILAVFFSGRRNYRYFFMFLISLSLHMTGIFVLCLVFILNHKEAEQLKTVTSIITIIIMVIISLLFIPIFGLTGFHIVLGKEDQQLFKKILILSSSCAWENHKRTSDGQIQRRLQSFQVCPAYHFSKNKTVIKCILRSQDVRNRHLHMFFISAKAVAPTAALLSAAHSIPGRTII